MSKRAKNQYGLRANESADQFRSLSALIAAGLIGFNVYEASDPNELSADNAMVSSVFALLALALLGLSWSIQKSKSLARQRNPFLPSSKLKPWLRNWWYDLIAYSILLFTIANLIFSELKLGILFAAIVGLLFLILAVLADCCVKNWELTCSNEVKKKSDKSEKGL